MLRLGGWKPAAALGLCVVAVCAGAAWLHWSTGSAAEASLAVEREQRTIRASVGPVAIAAPAGLEHYTAAGNFGDAAWFQQSLWIAASDGLWESSAEGTLVRRFSTGRDLPPAPLKAVAAVTLAGSRQPELAIGTMGEGVLLFDGRSLRQAVPRDPAYRKITALLALSSGQLVVGTARGVIFFDGREFTPLPAGASGHKVTALAGTLESLWIGTADAGVHHIKGGTMRTFSEAAGLPDRHVLSLAVAGESAFVGTSLGVAEFREGEFHRVLAEGAFAAALLPTGGRLLAGTLEEGIVEIPLDGRRAGRNAGGSPLPADVRRLLSDGGSEWAVARGGLYRRSGRGGWIAVGAAAPTLLADANIAALGVEDSGRVWVGYFDRGLDVIEPGGGTVRHQEDEHLFCVNRIVPRREGAVVATANGLVFTGLDGRPRRVLTKAQGLIASHVTDVLVSEDRMVVATPSGLTFLDPSGPQSLFAFHGLVNNHVYSLGRDGNRFFAGTLGGVSLVEGGVVQASYTTANSLLRHNWISALAGRYAGTYGAGVAAWNGSAWEPLGIDRFTVNPNALVADGGTVYAGTLEQGLAVWRAEQGRWSFHSAGLPSKNVTALARAAGFLYIGTDNGLVRMPERSLL